MNTGADRRRFLFLSLPLLTYRRCLDTAFGLSLVPFAAAKKAVSGRWRPIPRSRLLGTGSQKSEFGGLDAWLLLRVRKRRRRCDESRRKKKQKEPSPFHARATGHALARPAFCRPPKIARHFTAQAAPPGRYWQPGPALSGGAPFTCFAARAAQAPR